MERVIGVLDGKDETQKVEILLDCKGRNMGQLSLRLLSFGKGIGWYPQKTIEIDCRHLAALQTLCKKAEAILNTKRQSGYSGRSEKPSLSPQTVQGRKQGMVAIRGSRIVTKRSMRAISAQNRF